MSNLIDYTATEARTKLFDILNYVYFGDKEVRIIKNKKPMVRIIKETAGVKKKANLFELSGLLSGDVAFVMKKEVEKLKKLPTRNTY